MSLLGEISPKALEACKDFLDFTRCVKPDGSAYGTSGKCRLGVEQDKEEKINKMKKALSSSFEEFEKDFGPEFRKKISDPAEDFRSRTQAAKLNELSAEDTVKLVAAKRLAVTIESFHELEVPGVPSSKQKAANSLLKVKEYFDDMKWRLVNPTTFISEGTLRMAWDGHDVGNKANTLKDLSSFTGIILGQSKIAVGEHPYPTKELKSALVRRFSGKENPSDIAKFVMEKNIVSWTSFWEDDKMSKLGLKSSAPNEDVFSRYSAAKIKTFPLAKEFDSKQGLKTRALAESAKASKSAGQSFEEWAASVTNL